MPVQAGDRMKRIGSLGLCCYLASAVVQAGEADVVRAEAKRTAEGVYRFDVTLRHHDKGWGHYADRWEVITPAGKVIATRVLHHPHVDEQPFTRSLAGVRLPAGIESVRVRAHDSVHGYGGKEVELALPR